mmetsp:Transcript_19152/g.54404  ORF Transcript_19152/g.54404 Transcript_19152/m.54404 type:complete len:139 (+) Transcript_19152:631-1047(+)
MLLLRTPTDAAADALLQPRVGTANRGRREIMGIVIVIVIVILVGAASAEEETAAMVAILEAALLAGLAVRSTTPRSINDASDSSPKLSAWNPGTVPPANCRPVLGTCAWSLILAVPVPVSPLTLLPRAAAIATARDSS